jgi:hypothetical protein
MDQLYFWRKQLVDTVPHDGVSLATANFHQHPWAGNGAVNCFHGLFYQICIPILGHISHKILHGNIPTKLLTWQ